MPEGIGDRTVLVIDPILATDESASAAISLLKVDGVTKTKLLCIVAAPNGIETIEDDHTYVKIFCTVTARELNENAFILPGLRDAGTRVYGTK